MQKKGFRAKRYIAGSQLGISSAKHFRIRTSLKFKDNNRDIQFTNKFLEDILYLLKNTYKSMDLKIFLQNPNKIYAKQLYIFKC